MDTVTFRLKEEDSVLLYALFSYMKVSFKNERLKIDKINSQLEKISSLEEVENNRALQYEVRPLSEQPFANETFSHILSNDLTKKQRTAFLLNYFERYNIKEVADLMGIVPRTAKSYIDVALEKIKSQEREILGGHSHERNIRWLNNWRINTFT